MYFLGRKIAVTITIGILDLKHFTLILSGFPGGFRKVAEAPRLPQYHDNDYDPGAMATVERLPVQPALAFGVLASVRASRSTQSRFRESFGVLNFWHVL